MRQYFGSPQGYGLSELGRGAHESHCKQHRDVLDEMNVGVEGYRSTPNRTFYQVNASPDIFIAKVIPGSEHSPQVHRL